MSELWRQVTDNIDERFTDEAAEYLAKSSKSSAIQGSDYEGRVILLKNNSKEKKHSKGRLIAIIGAAAAAVAICVLGGIHLMKNTTPLLPADTSTTEVPDTLETQETGETSEATDVVVQPKINAVEADIVLSDTISYNDIVAQAGFDVPIDMDKHGELYADAVEHVNTLPDKQYHIDRNYLYEQMYVSYVGSDTADWICAINYYFNVDYVTPPIYSCFFYVKDGVITEKILESDKENGLYRDNRYTYIKNGGDGLFALDNYTMELITITADWAEHVYSYDECVVFRDRETDTLHVYVFATGETISLDFIDLYTKHWFMGDRLRYYDEQADEIYDLMLPSCELQTPDVELENAFVGMYNGYNEYYEIEPAEDNLSIFITEKATGETQQLFMSDFSDIYSRLYHMPSGHLRIYEHTLYIPFRKGTDKNIFYVKYDIPTGKAVYSNSMDIISSFMQGEHFIGKTGKEIEGTSDTDILYSRITFEENGEVN